jgi:hypothetical protein
MSSRSARTKKWIDVKEPKPFHWDVIHGVDGKEGQESLGPSGEKDLSKHYLLVVSVHPEGYAAMVLGIHPGDKIYGMSLFRNGGLGPTVKETRVANSDILKRIEDSQAAGDEDEKAKKAQAAANRSANKDAVRITSIAILFAIIHLT